MTDYYGLLEVAKDATADEIKKAYRRKTLKLHPDKNFGVEADPGAMAALTKAYEVLSDPVKRALYDVGGAEAILNGTEIDRVAVVRLKETAQNLLSHIVHHGANVLSLKEALTKAMQEAQMREVDHVDGARESLEVLKRQRKRLVRKDKTGSSWFEDLVDEHILQCAASIAQGEKSLSITRRACELLEELEDGRDESFGFTRLFMLGGS